MHASQIIAALAARGHGDLAQAALEAVTAGLKEDFLSKVNQLEKLGKRYKPGESVSEDDKAAMAAFAKWFRQNFRVDSAKTPRGMRMLKDEGQRLLSAMERYGAPGGTVNPLVLNIRDNQVWRGLFENTDDLVKHFTVEGDKARGKKAQVVEVKGKYATYFNRGNVSAANFKKYVERLDQIFGSLKGFHAKALKGNLKVAFVGRQQMQVQGKYRAATDELWVRATPQVMKRAGGTYASAEYIIVHELGHRYERRNRLPQDFDTSAWRTTKYSTKDGEAFAELFALSHFNIPGTWSNTVKRFVDLMR